MKEGWEVKKLGELTEIITKGTTPKTLGYNYTDEGINFIKVESITETGTFLIDNFAYVSNDCHKALLRSQLEENDLLFSIAGALGRTAIVSKSILPANTNQAVAIIRLVDKSELFLRYLQYYFKSNRVKEHINSIKVGVAQMNLSLGQLKDFLILVPPLPEQSRIVEELDLLSNIIEKKRQQLSELDNLSQSIFYDMFGDPVTNEKGWEVKKLGEVCDVRDGTHDSPKYIEHSDYVLITSKNIVNGDIDYTSINYISEEDYNNINKRSYVEDGDIIMAMIGTIGKPIIVKRKGIKFCIKNVALIKFAESRKVVNIYIQSLLDNATYKQYINKQNKGGTQKFISLGAIRKLDIALPPLSLQQLFAQKIEAIEKEKELIKQSIKETEELFNSRMDYYFS